MHISATVKNSIQNHNIVVSTENSEKKISIPAKADGKGSSVNGAELLFLSLATCFCNDIYREAARRQMDITSVEVKVDGEFGKEGEPASKIQYNAIVQSAGSSIDEINDLINHIDTIAEIHNTLRKGIAVTLKR